LSGVCRRSSSRSAGALGVAQAEDRVDGASRLERPGALEVLGLEEGSGADSVAERPAREKWGPGDVRSDNGAGAFDVGERNRQNTLRGSGPADYESFIAGNRLNA
jgi:hypothetical protein